MEKATVIVDDGTGDCADACAYQSLPEATHLNLKQGGRGGGHNEHTGDASESVGPSGYAKRKLEQDALVEQPDKRLKLEHAANATDEAAAEPGTTGEARKEHTAGSDEDSCALQVSDDEPGERALQVGHNSPAAPVISVALHVLTVSVLMLVLARLLTCRVSHGPCSMVPTSVRPVVT